MIAAKLMITKNKCVDTARRNETWEKNKMILYHISDTLQLGEMMSQDYKENMELVTPFVQALEKSEDCFYAMLLNAKLLKSVLGKFGLRDMLLFDEAFDTMWDNDDMQTAFACARRYLRTYYRTCMGDYDRKNQ